MQIDAESLVPHAGSLLRSGVNPLTTGAVSRRATNAINASVLGFGHSAYSAQPLNLTAASSNVIGSAGLPLPQPPPPGTALPPFPGIFMFEVIFSKPAPSPFGSPLIPTF